MQNNTACSGRMNTLEWVIHFIGPAILLWWLTSDTPFYFVMIHSIAILVFIFSFLRLLYMVWKVLRKKRIDEFCFLRPMLSVMIALMIMGKWSYAWADMQDYLKATAQDLRVECIAKGSCLALRPEWKSRSGIETEGYERRQHHYNNGLDWRVDLTSNREQFHIAFYTGLDGPSYSVCGGINMKPRENDWACHPKRPEANEEVIKQSKPCRR